jgi:drug/metabolite transporter (DMT)-like permease
VSPWAVHGALVVVQVAFAAGAVEGKLALGPTEAGGGGVSPLALAMARMLGAALFFQVLTRLRPGGLPPLSRADHGRAIGLSVLGIVLNQALFLIGLRITTAFAAALLGATIPVFTAALAVALRIEKPSARTAVGLALAVAGVVSLTGFHSLDLGALAIAANCLSYSLYLVLAKRTVERVGALNLVTWLFTWGVLVFSPFGGPKVVSGALEWGTRGWALVAFMIAGPTIVAYLFNAWALARSNPTVVSVYIYLQPLFAAVLQWVQLGETVERRAVVATAFILAGVGVVTTRKALGPPAES